MGRYGTFLAELLRPLGIYDLTEGSNSESELYALGKVLDTLDIRLTETEREVHPATAENAGLQLWETLLAKRNGAQTAQQRREAILALLQIHRDSLTPAAISQTLQGCGIRAVAEEVDAGHLRVRFPETIGEPEDFDRIRSVILDILPCHLEVEFVFRCMTWAECERQQLTWALIEAAGHTWASLEDMVPAE